MPLLKPIFAISEICSQKNIQDAILCPGSRSAALSLAFTRNPAIHSQVLSDERSAAFVGLGKALQTGRTVALVCTSGSAAYNFAPAIAEAFFQEIPLIVFTADRPPEWIHQYDGQTIFQREIYGKHVKKSYELPVDYTHLDALWQIERIINEALALTQEEPKGPVHINIPIREPFYPNVDENYDFTGTVRSLNFMPATKILNNDSWEQILAIWEKSERKMIAIGQNQIALNDVLNNFAKEQRTVILADIISNIQLKTKESIKSQDIFISKITDEKYFPELLITTGKSFISKSFKQFIRANKPKYHFHIQENGDFIDPFQSITHKINISPTYFFNELFEVLDLRKFKNGEDDDQEESFLNDWNQLEHHAIKYLDNFVNTNEFGELKATSMLLEACPTPSILHLGNSMPVRYANLLSSFVKNEIQIFANRGTSGIEGILSTAIGQALSTDKIVTCLIGDVSFFYDRNAFWTQNLPNNLRIVLINNAGGNIFRLIDGPNQQPELESNFVGTQSLNAKAICEEHNILYFPIKSYEEMEIGLANLFKANDKISLIEIFVDGKKDAELFKQFKNGFLI